MPFLQLDDGTIQPLPVPSTITIGRGSGNDIQPESQSISKTHAAVSVSERRVTGKLEAYVEDFDSRNGTYCGISPLELERVVGKRKINFGDYIKFGNSQTYFRYLEAPPPRLREDANDPSASLIQQQQLDGSRDRAGLRSSGSYVPKKDGSLSPNSRLPPPLSARDEHNNNNGDLRLNLNNHSPHHNDFAPESPWGGGGAAAAAPAAAATTAEAGDDPRNMTISIKYPTSGSNQLSVPVSITIDPPKPSAAPIPPPPISYANRGAGGGLLQSIDEGREAVQASFQQEQRRQPLAIASSSNEWMDDVNLGAAALSTAGGGGGGKRYNSKVGGGDGEHVYDGILPPPLGGGDWEPQLGHGKGGGGGGARSAVRSSGERKDTEGRGSRDRGGGGGGGGGGEGVSNSNNNMHLPMRREVSSPTRVSFLGGIPPSAADKASAQLVRRLWPDMKGLPVSTSTEGIVHELMGQQRPKREGEEDVLSEHSPLPACPLRVPDYVLAEALADRFEDCDNSVVGLLGGVLTELSGLLTQCIVGARIDSSSSEGGGAGASFLEASVELDSALHGVITTLLAESVVSLQEVLRSPYVQAVSDANNDGCVNNVFELLSDSLYRLERLSAFSNGEILRQESVGMRSEDTYATTAICLDMILGDLDLANALLYAISGRTDAPSGKKQGVGGIGGAAPSSSSSTALSLELEELRRLKGKANAKGASAALAAQIASFEQQTGMGGDVIGGAGGVFGGRGLKMSAEMSRLTQQEKAGGHKTQRLLRMLTIFDNDFVRAERFYFSKWKRAAEAIRVNFESKMKRFFRLLCIRGGAKLSKAFRIWEREMRAAKAALKAEQEMAKLKYDMCGMEARIHELSSQSNLANALAAERALNKELSAVNMELRLSVQELDSKFLDCANAPPALRKALVRDVLFGREDEVSFARREAKTLRDELQRLHEMGIKPSREDQIAAALKPFPRAPVPSEFQQRHNNESSNAAALRDAASRDAKERERERSSSPTMQMEHRPPPLAHKDRSLMHLPPPTYERKLPNGQEYKSTSPPPPKLEVLTKRDATVVIAQEVRRLSKTIAALQEDKDKLTRRVLEDASRGTQQTLAVQSLQRRITDRERSQAALRALLKQRIGDTGLMELTVALEEMGVGNSALLKEVAPFNAEQGGGGGGGVGTTTFLPPIHPTRQRGCYRDAIDQGLAFTQPETDGEESFDE